MNPTVLVYHKIDDNVEWGVTRVTVANFRSHIDLLLDHGYSFKTLSEIKNDGSNNKSVAITFDDAYESVFFNAYPVLKAHSLPATIFVISDFVGKDNTWDLNVGNIKFKHASWDQLRIMKDSGWEIGSHSRTHRDMRTLEAVDLKNELKESKAILEREIESEVKIISFPFGKTSASIIDAAIEAEYVSGTIFYPYRQRFNEEHQAFLIKRLGVYLWDYKFFFRSKLSNSHFRPLEIFKQNVLNSFANITIYSQGRKKR